MRFLFVLQLFFGLLMMLRGAAVAVRPYALLDQVLTEEELRDDEKHDATLALLKKTIGSDGVVWMGGGAAVSIMGILGFISAKRPPAPVESSSRSETPPTNR